MIEAIIQAVAEVPGVSVLDRHSDNDHNRTVLTFVGDPAGVEEAAYQSIAKAAELIDMNQHEGSIRAWALPMWCRLFRFQMSRCRNVSK